MCLVASGYEHAFKSFQKIQYSREITMIIITRRIPNVWSALWSHGPQGPNQSVSK